MIKILRTTLARTGGFTLIEFMIVLMIVGILGALAVPSFLSFRDHSRLALLLETGASLRAALASLAVDDVDHRYPANITLDSLSTGGVTLPVTSYALTYRQTGTPLGLSYALLLEDHTTSQQVCVTPAAVKSTTAGICP